MAEILIIQCHDQSCNKANWLIKGGGDSETSEGTLSEAAKQAKGRRTLVLIPATEVLITEVRLPTRNRQRLIQAIPFSLENDLTEDIDQLHFAAGNIDSENLTPVIVIAKQKLEHWLQKLDSVGIDPIGIYPDLLCLPLTQDSWSLYQDSQILHARTNTNSGFSVDAINGTATVNLALQQATEQAPKQINLYRLAGSPELVDLAQLDGDYEINTLDIDSHSQLTALLANHLVDKQRDYRTRRHRRYRYEPSTAIRHINSQRRDNYKSNIEFNQLKSAYLRTLCLYLGFFLGALFQSPTQQPGRNRANVHYI